MLAAAATALVLIFALTATQLRVPSSTIEANFIDVGQGDSILLRDGNGFNVLVDGGKPSAGPAVLAYLRAEGVTEIDVLVATHADADHAGGLIDVLEAADIPVLQVLYNGYPGDTQTWYDFATAVANEGMTPAPAQFPAEYAWGGMTAKVLSPLSGLGSPEQNNASVVLLVEHGSIGYLLTGDIDSTAEAEIVARGTPVAADILKVGHHGSRYSSGADFLAAVTYFTDFYVWYNDQHPLTTLGMLTPNQVHTGQAASLLAARQTHQAEAFTSRRVAGHAPITLEELTAQPLPDVSQCPVYSWAGPAPVPQNTRHPLRN